MKTKRKNKLIFSTILFLGFFLSLSFPVNSKAATDNCVCSSGGAFPGYYAKDATLTTSSSDDCKNQCMGITDSKYYSYSDVANLGFKRIYNCLCVEGSLIPFRYPINSKFDTASGDACHQQCANQGTKYFSYSNVANLGTTKVTKSPSMAMQAATPEVTKHFDYTLLESFPGFFQANTAQTDLPTMILAIYKFGIWTVGIAGFFMLVVGGFMYIASAGNTSAAGSAKGIILDAILGIVAALGAYVILYVINPELTRINISFTKVNEEESDFGGTSESDKGNQATAGGCIKPVNEARKAKSAGWVYNQDLNLRAKTINGIRYSDCSNLVESSYLAAGCKSPGSTTESQYAKAIPFANKSNLKAGDAVVKIGHVVMCIDDGCNQMIHFPGKGRPITIKSDPSIVNKTGSWSGAKVIKAANYCGGC